ncbi:MAG: GntR family transcriptional regulator [Pseudorhodoplanes sp.]|uniref:GntR family transcriptional regulator n=1 Tax=Pseudorhodoplanes sp. TaxID=1934341 RepID=UPI003D111DC4
MKKLRRTSLSGDAYSFVRELFVNGNRYNPGDKISVEELSRELGVSRTPLWGAINRLEAEGIVEIVPRQGVYLINYDPQRVIEIYLAREAIEGMAARLAAERITDRQIAGLRSNIDDQMDYLRKGDVDRYYASALEFHEQVVRISGNQTLERLLMSVLAQIRAMRVQRKYTPTHLPHSCDDHERLLQALRLRDPDRAEREARSHIRDLTEEIRRSLAPSTAPIGAGRNAAVAVPQG